MKQKTVLKTKGNNTVFKAPNKIWKALKLAIAETRLEIIHDTYLQRADSSVLRGCAIGSVAAMCVPWRTALKMTGDRDILIEKICKNIPHACDKVPLETWNTLAEKHGFEGVDKDEYEDVDEDSREQFRYIDLAEELFENSDLDFDEMIPIFKELNH